MAGKISAGLLMYCFRDGELHVLLVHPGGPYFKSKDAGYWTIPKGEPGENEELLATAIREFEEEIGIKPAGEFIPLDWVKQKGGKTVYAWAFQGDYDSPPPLKSNLFEIEWPPRSGKKQQFPEIDKAEFFPAERAKQVINKAQVAFIERLEKLRFSRAVC
ncbi:MAG: NUDIX domain-containing protein [Dehalococcoidia bacterium]